MKRREYIEYENRYAEQLALEDFGLDKNVEKLEPSFRKFWDDTFFAGEVGSPAELELFAGLQAAIVSPYIISRHTETEAYPHRADMNKEFFIMVSMRYHGHHHRLRQESNLKAVAVLRDYLDLAYNNNFYSEYFP